MEDRPYQTKGHTAIKTEFDNGVYHQIISMATGTGKCLAPGTPVMMFDGSIKAVEEVSVGESLMGPDSMPRNVLALGSGRSPMYDVVPVKGGIYRANGAHILSLYMTRKGHTFPCQQPRFINISVDDYLKKGSHFKHCAKGYRTSIDFPFKPTTVDPYFLGLWLGDGSSHNSAVTSEDVEVEAFMEMYAEYLGLQCRKQLQKDNASSVYLISTGHRGSRDNVLLNMLRELGVADNKHVPFMYKANDRETRIQLLSGYLDADGSLSHCGGYDYISISKTLCEDIAFVARSLGLACYTKECRKGCQTGAVGTYYRGQISGNTDMLKCKLERKQNIKVRRQIKNPLVTGIKVVPAGEGEYYGFQIDGDGRFLLGDFTVTHNTIMFARLFENMRSRLPGQQLVLAHREELVTQAVKKIQKVNPHLRVDMEIKKHYADPSLADIIVASKDSLHAKRRAKYNWEHVDKIVTDEAHHSVADSYLNIYEDAGFLREEDKRLLLGVTATPQRGDGKALAKLYKKITYVYSMRQAIEEGWLVDVKGIRVRTDTSLDGIKTVAGDLDPGQLSDTVNNPKRNQLAVRAWLDHGKGRQTVGFCVDIQHAKDAAEMFKQSGIAAEAIWGDDPQRAEKLALHREGAITVLLNFGVLTEGYDDWRIGCILMMCPTKSAVKYIQCIGRGTRLEELADGTTPNLLDWKGDPIKQDCVVIDLVDSSSRHSLQTVPTLMGMASSLDLKGQSVYKAIKQLEDAQKEYQNVDFSKLEDITKLKTFIESVNLFEVKFLPEVESNSQLCWHPAANGGYVMLLPNNDEVRITQNLLDKYELIGHIKGKRYKGERDTLEAAFARADELVQDTCSEALKILTREAPWHKNPATEAQLKLIAKLYKGKAIPNDLSSGQASKLIGQRLAGKRT